MGYIHGQSSSPIEFERLLEALAEIYPETVQTGEYFETRIAREEQIADELGMPLDSAPIASTRDAARRQGPQPTFSVSISSSLSFKGRFCQTGVWLHANRDFDLPETQALTTCLESTGYELEICCSPK